MVPNMSPLEGEDTIKELLDESMQPMTREAEFDLRLSLGNGLPTDKAFVYQTLLDLAKLTVEGKPVISWQEIRNYLRTQVGLPLESDDQFNQMMMPGAMTQPPGAGGLPPTIPPQLQVMQGGAPV